MDFIIPLTACAVVVEARAATLIQQKSIASNYATQFNFVLKRSKEKNSFLTDHWDISHKMPWPILSSNWSKMYQYYWTLQKMVTENVQLPGITGIITGTSKHHGSTGAVNHTLFGEGY